MFRLFTPPLPAGRGDIGGKERDFLRGGLLTGIVFQQS